MLLVCTDGKSIIGHGFFYLAAEAIFLPDDPTVSDPVGKPIQTYIKLFILITEKTELCITSLSNLFSNTNHPEFVLLSIHVSVKLSITFCNLILSKIKP
jgi:hypothetical protein